jgi:hypothetical protein
VPKAIVVKWNLGSLLQECDSRPLYIIVMKDSPDMDRPIRCYLFMLKHKEHTMMQLRICLHADSTAKWPFTE